MLTASDLDLRRETLSESADLRGLARRLAERAAPLLERAPVRPARKALLSKDGGVCPDDGASLAFDPWSPARPPVFPLWADGHGRAARSRVGQVSAPLAGRAGRDPRGARRDGGGSARRRTSRGDPGGIRLQLLRLSQPGQRARAGPPVLLDLSGVHLDHELPRGGDPAARERRPARRCGGRRRGGRRRGRGTDRRIRRGIVQPAGLAQRRARGDRRLVRGRRAGDPLRAGLERHARAPAPGLRRRRHVVRGRELPSLRASRSADRDGLGAAGGGGSARGSAPGRPTGGRAAWRRRLPRCPITRFPRARTRASACRWPSRCTSSSGRWVSRAWATADSDLWSWLRELYAAPAPAAQTFDSYLHDAGEPAAPATRARTDLSWWALLEMVPSLPEGAPWSPGSVLMADQGLAVLRNPRRYASLECGRFGGGHGHPDRLQLTLHADGRALARRSRARVPT